MKTSAPLSMIRNAKEVYVDLNGDNDVYSARITKSEGRRLIKTAGNDLQCTVYEDGKVVTIHRPF